MGAAGKRTSAADKKRLQIANFKLQVFILQFAIPPLPSPQPPTPNPFQPVSSSFDASPGSKRQQHLPDIHIRQRVDVFPNATA